MKGVFNISIDFIPNSEGTKTEATCSRIAGANFDPVKAHFIALITLLYYLAEQELPLEQYEVVGKMMELMSNVIAKSELLYLDMKKS
jgi:hypothetical protein